MAHTDTLGTASLGAGADWSNLVVKHTFLEFAKCEDLYDCGGTGGAPARQRRCSDSVLCGQQYAFSKHGASDEASVACSSQELRGTGPLFSDGVSDLSLDDVSFHNDLRKLSYTSTATGSTFCHQEWLDGRKGKLPSDAGSEGGEVEAQAPALVPSDEGQGVHVPQSPQPLQPQPQPQHEQQQSVPQQALQSQQPLPQQQPQQPQQHQQQQQQQRPMQQQNHQHPQQQEVQQRLPPSSHLQLAAHQMPHPLQQHHDDYAGHCAVSAPQMDEGFACGQFCRLDAAEMPPGRYASPYGCFGGRQMEGGKGMRPPQMEQMELQMESVPRSHEMGGPAMHRQMRGHVQPHLGMGHYGMHGGSMRAPPQLMHQARQMHQPPPPQQYDGELYDDHCLPAPYAEQLQFPHQMQLPQQAGQRARKGSGKGRQRMTSQDEDQSIAETLVPLEPKPLAAVQQDMGDTRTTVMLRNIPNNYSRAMFLDMLDGEGFCGKYNFVYVPIDFKSGANLGYAFVNLVSPSAVPEFWITFDGFRNWSLPSHKVSEVKWSGPYQGLKAHIDRYRNSSLMHEAMPDEYKPMVFVDGVRAVFPPPTKKLRVPGMALGGGPDRDGPLALLPGPSEHHPGMGPLGAMGMGMGKSKGKGKQGPQQFQHLHHAPQPPGPPQDMSPHLPGKGAGPVGMYDHQLMGGMGGKGCCGTGPAPQMLPMHGGGCGGRHGGRRGGGPCGGLAPMGMMGQGSFCPGDGYGCRDDAGMMLGAGPRGFPPSEGGVDLATDAEEFWIG